MSAPAPVLIATIAFALVSFICSAYTTLRTLLPLLPLHALERRVTGSAGLPYGAAPAPTLKEKSRRMKSAQRFTTYLAVIDIAAACVLVWEAAVASGDGGGLGATKAGASRLFFAAAARPTLLLVVATLSYLNVVSGKSVRLGAYDHIVWLPPALILALGAGLAYLCTPSQVAQWAGLLVWLSITTAVVSACFGRLLLAILRVRKASRKAARSPFESAQSEVVPKGSKGFLPPLHTNFSGLSASFLGVIGRSNPNSLDLPHSARRDVVEFSASHAPAVSYSPAASIRGSADDYSFDPQEVSRSPTPGSTRGLLASTRTFGSALVASPVPSFARTPSPAPSTPGDGGYEEELEHEVISFENMPRPSMGSYTSSMTQGGLVGGTAMRQAVAQEVWGSTPVPGSGYSSATVELSGREARMAVVRIGGHLGSCLLGFALILPFLVERLISPITAPPIVVSILLAAAVSQPGLVLAWQTVCSEGFKYTPRRPPPVLTSSSALTLERHLTHNPDSTLAGHEVEDMREHSLRPGTAQSNASTYYLAPSTRAPSPMPGVPTDGGDAKEVKSAWGRALEMARPHPKLLVLPTRAAVAPSAEATGFRSVARQGHARLRSLNLSKTSLGTFGTSRERTGSGASRATVGGLEDAAEETGTVEGASSGEVARAGMIPADVVAMALLEEPARPRPSSFIGNGLLPFTLGTAPASRSAPDLTASASAVAADLLAASNSTGPFDFRAHKVQLSVSAVGGGEPWPVSSTPRAGRVTIDWLSSKVLPEMVPGLVMGRGTEVEGREVPGVHERPRRRTSLGAVPVGNSGEVRNRNIRNLSLPGFLPTGPLSSLRSATPSPNSAAQDEHWISISPSRNRFASTAPPSALESITSMVRGLDSPATTGSTNVSAPVGKRDSRWKDRTARAWDELEAKEQEHVQTRRPKSRRKSLLSMRSRRKSRVRAGVEEIEMTEREREEEAEEEANLADDSAEEEGLEEEAEVSAELEIELGDTIEPVKFEADEAGRVGAADADATAAFSLEGSVVLCGSQYGMGSTGALDAADEATEEMADQATGLPDRSDDEVGQVHHATAGIRPASRASQVSLSSVSQYSLRPTHLAQQPSVSSLSSFRSGSEGRSITSVGYLNMLESRGGTWTRTDSSGDEQPSFGRHSRAFGASARAGTPDSSRAGTPQGLRPLRLLGQRDPNVSASDRESDSDNTGAPSKAVRRGSRQQAQGPGQDQNQPPAGAVPQTPAQVATRRLSGGGRRASGLFAGLQDVPDTILEAEDEDRKTSGTRTPTPRTIRARRAAAGEQAPPVPPIAPVRPARRNSGGIPYRHSVSSFSSVETDEGPLTSTPPRRLVDGEVEVDGRVAGEGAGVHVTRRTRARARRLVTSSQEESGAEGEESRRPSLEGVGGGKRIKELGATRERGAVGGGMRGFR